MFLPATVIYHICIIYIYFYILHRVIIYGLRFVHSVSRKVIAVSRIVWRCMRGALWCFIEIISITVPALYKVAFVYQLNKLVRYVENGIPTACRMAAVESASIKPLALDAKYK